MQQGISISNVLQIVDGYSPRNATRQGDSSFPLQCAQMIRSGIWGAASQQRRKFCIGWRITMLALKADQGIQYMLLASR